MEGRIRHLSYDRFGINGERDGHAQLIYPDGLQQLDVFHPQAPQIQRTRNDRQDDTPFQGL